MLLQRILTSFVMLCSVLCIGLSYAVAQQRSSGLTIQNGWYVQDGRVIWGYGQHNGWWRPGQRPNLTRNAPGDVRPNRTEDLDKLTDAMLRFGYPGFEHNFGLWYDRRRDEHDTNKRTDSNAVPPFLEQPWARSGSGTAWDGLSQYDLLKFNDWYFARLKKFADLCDRKGTILFHNFYMQHALLETNAHYVDFPWRPANCIQETLMPDRTPAANAFYDVSQPLRRKLHRAYIRKCLDTLGHNTNVVFLCSEEYTGPLSFMQFWLDTIFEWEEETGRNVHVGLNGTKDVVDAILADAIREPRVSTIDLRYWWYKPDGSLFAPKGGQEVPGRFVFSFDAPAQQIYRQVREYRNIYPDKALLHFAPKTRQQAWAALMAGGSMLIGQLPFAQLADPPKYVAPEKCKAIQTTYDFVREELGSSLPRMKPNQLVVKDRKTAWCLSEPGKTYLIYAMNGGQFQLNLSAANGSFQAKWFDPRSGKLSDANGGSIQGGRLVKFSAPDHQDWALWLDREATISQKKESACYSLWSKIELSFSGPDSQTRGTPNPFAIRFDVTFRSPNGKTHRVPGFYDGDGSGGEDGNVWKVRFSADEQGMWFYLTESSDNRLDGSSGRFNVTGVLKDAKGFSKWGRLEYTGTLDNGIRYLKFRDGPYWLKAGCDDPENFLGNYQNYNTLAKRKTAIDYLAQHGINSLYIMTHNIDGDDNDVWPWLGTSAEDAKRNARHGNVRFDIAKLNEWRNLFEHMQDRGVVPYLILEDDSAWTDYNHDRYYREIVARFADMPALLINIGEENNENYPLPQGLALAKRFKELDPYDHPLGIHHVNLPNDAYIDSPYVDFTSIQTGQPETHQGLADALEHNQIASAWIAQCRSRNRRVLMVNFDEGRPELDRRAWWSAYLGGGVWEAHVVGPYDQPYSAWETTWKELGGTRTFMQSLPFYEMNPRNDLVKSGQAFCLAKPGDVYALYLPNGGQVSVRLAAGTNYEFGWWDPCNGKEGRLQNTGRISGGVQPLTAPSESDWALRIVKLTN